MGSFYAVILGVIQGLTEFLPISSSGHLVIFQHLFGLVRPELFFDASLHVGTMAAVIVVFWKEIQGIILSFAHFLLAVFNKKVSLADSYKDNNIKFALLIIAGSIPTAVIGFSFHKIADQLFSSTSMVGVMLFITGSILLGTRYIKPGCRDISSFKVKDALIIGAVQGLAIIPGISRSGSTIAAGLFLKLDREIAAKYSFLLSVPAIFGAEIITFKNLTSLSVFSFKVTILGTFVSFIAGYCALKILLYVVRHGRLYLFAPYCWIAGSATLILLG